MASTSKTTTTVNQAAVSAAKAAQQSAIKATLTPTISSINASIAALGNLVNTKNPTAAQQAAAQKANAAMTSAVSSQAVTVNAANLAYANSVAAATTTTADTSADAATQDAYALIQSELAQWGLGELATILQNDMANNIGPNQAVLDIRNSAPYKARFAGNFTRQTAGLNMLTEAEYLAMENSYANLFNQYGTKTLANKAQFATLIGNDVSATELNNRLDLAVNQVQQADPTVLNTLKQYYPTVSNSDLVSYFLAPTETLPMLQQQVGTAQVGAAAAQQGLSDTQQRAQQLQQLGVSYSQAQTGYGKIAEVLPASQKLSNIYGAQTGINYNQTEAENQYLLSSGAASLEQQKLIDLEKQQFSGRSGVVGASAAAGYGGSLGKSIQGQF
jgi:hypothetical protein